MANETTTTTLTELVNSEFINEAILDYAHDHAVAAPYLNWMDLRGKATKTGSFPKKVLDAVTAPTNEVTELAAAEFETTDVQIAAVEIGVRRDVTDAALEETILGAQIFNLLVQDAGVLMGISLDNDIVALFGSLSTNVGATTVDLSLANMVEAQAQVRINGMRGSLVYILDDQQASDYQAAQAASTTTTVSDFFQVAHGIESGYLGTFMGAPVWQTGLCDTANAGADVAGACFIDGAASKAGACFGGVMTRDIKTELERNASMRQTEFVATAKWGVGEISDLSGCSIITDA